MYKSASRFMQSEARKAARKKKNNTPGWGKKKKQKPQPKPSIKTVKLPGIKWEPSLVQPNTKATTQALAHRRYRDVAVEIKKKG
ncbi:hypothetical protein [Bradyrhizobium elkanii]|uniref:hypothetical protein n=1 Tax=Bradyrhizobium elkanii TaxID=29448 RepID=UPI003D1D7B97